MKNYIFLFVITALVLSCKAPVKEETPPPASTIVMPYTATYSSQFTQDISDQDVFTVLNSYKSWENGDMKMVRDAFADSLTFTGWDGRTYTGPSGDLIDKWAPFRDSLSSVKIKMAAWTKNHAVDKNGNVIGVWYTEIDTYKTGKIDSAEWHDLNVTVNGKIVWYAQYRRPFKAK